MQSAQAKHFRELCAASGLAVTHQRQALYEVLRNTPGHPSPEEVYARVKRKIPAISLGTVYKNINLFIESGIFSEVSLHHGSRRVETNSKPHHHLVCTVCKSISDIDEAHLGLVRTETTLPGGFQVERYAVDVLGRCAECQKRS